MTLRLPSLETNFKIAIIGLGYVGLPLAVEFAKYKQRCGHDFNVIGFDISDERLSELSNAVDKTNEIDPITLSRLKITYTSSLEDLAAADIFIITVPTPIDNANRPDLTPLIAASSSVAKALNIRSSLGPDVAPVIIYESTVYPTATEDVSVPIIEQITSLAYNKEFFVGYSPERINPGDKEHTLPKIKKVVSGSTPDVARWVDCLYTLIITAGTYRASSIKVAEAAKVIENIQRDLNIALVNEFSIIFRNLEIDIFDVLSASKTKWNFLPFSPGLVGGHCIGVDPYYLTHIAELTGYYPELVLAGRRINESKAKWVISELVKEMVKRDIRINSSQILILGFTFKENCPDDRNTKVIDLIQSLKDYHTEITVVDPYIDCKRLSDIHGVSFFNSIDHTKSYSVVVLAVAHRYFDELSSEDLLDLCPSKLFLDLKGRLPDSLFPVRL